MRETCLNRWEIRREWSEKRKLLSISRCGQRSRAATDLSRPPVIMRSGPSPNIKGFSASLRSAFDVGTHMSGSAASGTSVSGSATPESSFPIALRREVTQPPLGVLTDLRLNGKLIQTFHTIG